MWEDNNKEVVYKGVLHDVLKIQNQNGKVYISLIPDIKEQELKRIFAQFYSEKTNKSLSLLNQFLSLKYISTNHLIVLKQVGTFFKHDTEYRLNIISLAFSTVEPPPNSFI